MATAMNSAIGQKGISTLDVLWAFYVSQPRQIKKAFRSRLESEENMEEQKSVKRAQWQTDLKEIRSLKAGWDDENAPRINRDAIAHVNNFVASMDGAIVDYVRLFPTALGAVMLKYETGKGRVKCEFGDKVMSYFVKRNGLPTEHHSFEDINKDSLAKLAANIKSIV